MASGTRSGLKPSLILRKRFAGKRLNGQRNPFGFETSIAVNTLIATVSRLNGQRSPFGFETMIGVSRFVIILIYG